MSTQSPQLDQADRELLVAYLDGELSAEDCAVVESRLTSDELFRHELQDLQRAWDALNELPRPTAPESFTRTTIEMVTVAAQEEVQSATHALPVRRRRYLARLLAVALAALLAGVLLALVVWPDRNRQLIDNLPIIENVEAYRHLEDIASLQQLHERLGERLAHISPLGGDDVNQVWEQWRAVSGEDAAVRRARVQRMSRLDPAAAGSLQAKWNRYELLGDADKQRLGKLHEDLLQSDQSSDLFATVARFGDLIARQTAGERNDFRSKPTPEEKLDVVEGWVRAEERRHRIPLTLEDRQKLRQFLWQNALRRRHRQTEGGTPSEEQSQAAARLEEVISSLSPQAQAAIKQDRGEGGEPRAQYRWLWDNVGFGDRGPEDEELFLSIEDNDEKARLLVLPTWEMHRNLRQRFIAPFADGPRMWRGGPGRADGRGGREGGPSPGRRPPPQDAPPPPDSSDDG